MVVKEERLVQPDYQSFLERERRLVVSVVEAESLAVVGRPGKVEMLVGHVPGRSAKRWVVATAVGMVGTFLVLETVEVRV